MTPTIAGMKPRIAIPVPTLKDAAYNDLNWQAYADAVESTGGIAVRVPLQMSANALRALARTCVGVVLPGSPADVAPEHYGQTREEFTADADLAREAVDRVLLDEAWVGGTPLLAICFGMQMLNVCRGGTLVQDLTPVPVNHSAGRGVAVAHRIAIDSGSRLSEMARDATEDASATRSLIWVNSSHHQAVGHPGRGIRVTARSVEDGVVEAIEADRRQGFVVGVQWHPERTMSTSKASRTIFESFIQECHTVSAAEGMSRAGA